MELTLMMCPERCFRKTGRAALKTLATPKKLAWKRFWKSSAVLVNNAGCSILGNFEEVTVREIVTSEEIDMPAATPGVRGMLLGETEVELVNGCCRLIELLATPRDIPFLAKLKQREIIYRLLQSTQGERLRSIAILGNHNHRTAKAIEWLSANFQKALRVEQLEAIAGMGISTFHHHFRNITAMSPLQYQKRIRLAAARQRMLVDKIDAVNAGFEVGYESASQFKREYKRFFGQPPKRSIQASRLLAMAKS